MQIDHSFYEDEIRCDYYITSMVKRSWAAQLEILADVDTACSQNGLEYYADWGTLLGTIRHQGFIPWDDDMDICMKRKDYDRFINNVSSLLPDNYSIVNYRSSRDFKQMLSRIVSSDHYRFDPEYMHKYSGLPIALGIDIFPMDYLTDDADYEKDREERIRLVKAAADEIAYFDTPVSDLKDYLRKIEVRCHTKFDRSKDMLTQLRHLMETLFGEVDEKEAEYITIYPLWMNGHRYRFPRKYYDEAVKLPFENMNINVPVHYDEILRIKYGTSYMKQVRTGGAHDYPYYEDHLTVLRDSFGFEWPSYAFKASDMPQKDRADNTGLAERKSCLFITYCAGAFDNMRDVARHYIDDGYEVTILPVTKYDIAADMTGIEASPDDRPASYYTEGLSGAVVCYDGSILDSHPDVIVTNYQYDEYNLITTVDKAYYSGNLRRHCDRLVFVPPFEARSQEAGDERARKLMPSYVCTALITACDGIIVHSDEMKQRYVECLSAWSGEGYTSAWESKITVLARDQAEDTAPHGSRRKIMFYVGISFFAEYGEAAIDKIRRSFDIFHDNRDRIEVVYVTQDGLSDSLKRLYPDLYDMYVAGGFPDPEDTISADDCDAYYGEASAYATEFVNAHKPVMIMNI